MKMTLDYAPKENGDEFDKWCEKYGFNPLNSGRRAWCSELSTYFRGASGVATNANGAFFLFYPEDVLPAQNSE